MRILIVDNGYSAGMIRLIRLLQPVIATADIPDALGDEASSRGYGDSSGYLLTKEKPLADEAPVCGSGQPH